MYPQWIFWTAKFLAGFFAMYSLILLASVRQHVDRKQWEENHPGLNWEDWHR